MPALREEWAARCCLNSVFLVEDLVPSSEWTGEGSHIVMGRGLESPGGREVKWRIFPVAAFFLGSSAGQWWGRIAEHALSASGSLWIAVESFY